MIRLFFVGQQRIAESIVTLNFDRFIHPEITHTYLYFGPSDPPDNLLDLYKNHNIDITNITVVRDCDLMKKYPNKINFYEFGGWITQQLVKLMAVDSCDSEQILIQDCDTFLIQPINFFVNNSPVPLVSPNGRPGHSPEYYEYFTKFTDLNCLTQESYVTEFMPVSKSDWSALKAVIEKKHNKHWLSVLVNQFKEDCKIVDQIWFSEYELLGHWLRNQHYDLRTNNHRCYCIHKNTLDFFLETNSLPKNLDTFGSIASKGFDVQLRDVPSFIDYINRSINK